MRIIKVESLPNGSHVNQTFNGSSVPNGYAIIPKEIDTPNFPFGDIEVTDGIVTKWTPLPIPEPEPIPPTPLTQEEKNTANIDYIAMMSGIDLPETEVAE